jgi:hypothetical protein
MALQVSIESESLGYVFPEAYARISQIVAYNNNSQITVVFYADAEARAEMRMQVTSKQYIVETPTLHGEIYKLGYEYIKTLPEFAGSMDLLGPTPQPIQPTQGPAEA